MSERPVAPTADIVSRQHLAGDPSASAWVEANAGAGKTHVLTERVLRLLLTGVAPENLLCLTYTKAAAAEMRRRVADRLGAWAVMAEAELTGKLTALTGDTPDAAMLRRARTLFGHALETPGGLKINTIHAFCESVLHRFPLEAGVPFAFKVVEDAEQTELIRAARESVFAEGIAGKGPCPEAVSALFARMSDTQIDDAIRTALARANELKSVLADRPAAKGNLRQLSGYRTGETVAELRRKIVTESLLPPERYFEIFAVCPPDPAKGRFEDKLARIDASAPDPDTVLLAFLNQDGTIPKSFPKKALRDAASGIGDTLIAEAERLAALAARLHLAALIERSEALVDVLGAIHERYQAHKRAGAYLDFDDLVAGMVNLLGKSESSAWVRYKLDAGIAHILVDESQDTNPAQWEVVQALAGEFFERDERLARPRTIFAVGDRKQSIYSFQGADPRLFDKTGAALRYRAQQLETSGQWAFTIWNRVRLRASFRTLPEILAAVDRVCAQAPIAASLLTGDGYEGHESARTDRGGSVTLWPVVRQSEMQVPEGAWPMSEDAIEQRNAARILAERIAGTIRGWLDDGRLLAQRGRAITADDILILVQSRGPVFQEIVRALKEQQLPSPGSDRLPVSTHLAVQDLLTLADIILNPADDLSLAAVLRSPLFDIDEEGLFALAANREKGVRLWTALRAATEPAAIAAFERLARWRSRADFDRPYDVFARILYAEGGLKRFHARMGDEVDDVLAEFLDLALDHERKPQPSLQGFIAEMRNSDISIGRDLAESGGGVRVMTVHGAKGLEAPIVFLADAAAKPEGRKLGKPVYVVSEAPGPLLVHANRREAHVAATLPFRTADEANQQDEYWRKLYVGMTRAEDELYVTGTLSRTGSIEGTWYEAVADGLEGDLAACAGPEGEPAMRFPTNVEKPAALKTTARRQSATRTAYEPAPLPAPRAREIIRPSSAGPAGDEAFATTAESLIDAELARKQGIALHALLQHLSRIDAGRRLEIGLGALALLLPEWPDRHERLVRKAIAILEAPANAQIFGPNSRAETPFLADGSRDGAPVRIAGRIDRLLVADDHVLAVDFKSDANPPRSAKDVSAAYLTQLGLYVLVGKKLFAPRRVRAAIFWTEDECLMALPESVLSAATAGFTLA